MKWYTDDWFVGVCGVLLLAASVFGYSYGLYRVGKYIERRDLTKTFVKMTELTYQDGFGDGFKKGQKAGLKTCDDVLNAEDGRY